MNKIQRFVASIIIFGTLIAGVITASKLTAGSAVASITSAPSAKTQDWSAWRQKHKHVAELGRTIRGLARLQENPATRLNHAQAQAILLLISKWRTKPVITDVQAAAIIEQIDGKLSKTQKLALAADQQRPGGPGGWDARRGGSFGGWGGHPGGPDASGRPSGPPPPGGPGDWGGHHGGPGAPGFDPSKAPASHEYNPLNPATSPFPGRHGRGEQALERLIALLKAA